MARYLVLAIALTSALVAAGPRSTLPELPTLTGMTHRASHNTAPVDPQCFAYAPATHQFACLGHGPIFNMNDVAAPDQATNLRIDVIGPSRRSWTIAAIGGRPTTPRATVAVELDKLGLRALTARPLELRGDRWVDLGAARVQLRTKFFEDDGGFLTIRCPDDAERVIDLPAQGINLGDTAWAFRAPDPGWVAISMAGVEGGEGTSNFSLDTLVIDLATTCKRPAAATGSRDAPSLWTTR